MPSSIASIEPDWDEIVLDAVLANYNQFIIKGNQPLTKDEIKWFSYSSLVRAVASMRLEKNVLVCKTGCQSVQEMWNNEKELYTRIASNIDHNEKSAVKKILQALLTAADYRNDKDEPITELQSTNLFGRSNNWITTSNEQLLKGGGTKRVDAWRRNLTQRLQRFRKSNSNEEK
jgi:hypothetical protein